MNGAARGDQRSEARCSPLSCCIQKREAHPRDVYSNAPEQNAHGRYMRNGVHTTKYTLLSFLPKNLWEQFQRAANVYFLIISFLTSLPTSAKDPTALIGTFVAVLTFTAVKEAYEDFQRYKNDKAINRRPVRGAQATRSGSLASGSRSHSAPAPTPPPCARRTACGTTGLKMSSGSA